MSDAETTYFQEYFQENELKKITPWIYLFIFLFILLLIYLTVRFEQQSSAVYDNESNKVHLIEYSWNIQFV